MSQVFVRASSRARAYVRGVGVYLKSGKVNNRAIKKLSQRGRANAKSLTELGRIGYRENIRILRNANMTVKGRRAFRRTIIATKLQRKGIRF